MYGQALPLAVTYLREEPDALMSAVRLCAGGTRQTGVPSAIADWHRKSRPENWERPPTNTIAQFALTFMRGGGVQRCS